MATAPFQLWVNGPTIATATRTASTVTVNTLSTHGISTGAYVQVEGCIGTAGTSANGVFQVTVTSGTTFTYTAAGSAGTVITGGTALTTEAFAYDLLNPLVNYSGTARDTALYVPLESIQMSASGDSEPASFSFSVAQDDTPSSTPWFLTIPDNTRVRLVKANTGDNPATGQTLFRGFVTSIAGRMSGSGQGSFADVSCVDVNAVFDRVVVYGRLK
jgi:hypothetical protein